MRSAHWKQFATLAVGVIAALGLSSFAFAQETVEERLQRAEKQFEENRKIAAELQKQNETLMKLLNSRPEAPPVAVPGSAPLAADDVRSIVSRYLQEKEAQQKAAAGAGTEEDSRYKIASNLSMSATWTNGLFLATSQKDFTMHIGGWIQYDNVWWDESTSLQNPKQAANAGPAQKVLSGPSLGGIGSLEDGTYFRRVRFQTNGTFWENYEYNLTLALENIQYSTVGMDEFWVGMTNIPFVGTVRLGHVKNAQGLEAGRSASTRTETFMEGSSYAEAINLNQYDVTGIWLGNNYFDQRTTWSATVFRADNAALSGTYFGNDQWGAQGRLTALPIYENEGRQLLHLGLSGGWRSGTGSDTARAFDLRARPELRDDAAAGSPSGTQLVPNANSTRMVDTGSILCNNAWLLGAELLYICGPFSIQGEYGWNHLEDAIGANNANPGTVLIKGAPQSYTFSGRYIQLAYTLTGENRSYEKRLGRLDSWYFGREGNFNNFWFVRDEDGRLNWNFGAWEIAARYSFVDLNSGQGLDRINGGEMDGVTLGLNWYLNDNVKLMFDYVINHRFNLPGLASGTPTTSTVGGTTNGFGMRMQFQY